MPIRVTFDTSALRADVKFRRGPTEALSRFAEAEYVTIVLPKIVADEFGTPRSTLVETFDAFKRALRQVRQNLPDEVHGDIDAFEDRVGTAVETVAATAKANLSTWMQRTGAAVVLSGADHSSRVLDRYFAGRPPFRTVKAREDFPDAFILESIADLAKDDDLFVVAGDKRLASALTELPRVSVFQDVKSLLEADEFEDLRSDVEADNVIRIVNAVNDSKQLFQAFVDDGFTNLIGGALIRGSNPRYSDDDEEDLYIETAGPVVDWELDTLSVEHLGEGVISVVCHASVEVSLDTSTGFYDESDYRSTHAIVDCDAAVSISMDLEELRAPRATWSGADLLNIATFRVDEILDRWLKFPYMPGA